MREIKFRGKRLDNNEWVFGYYSKSTPIFEGVEHSYITPICENGSIDMSRKVHPETVGQYACFRDKNGKEIYEGDISGGSPYCRDIGVVKWHNTGLSICLIKNEIPTFWIIGGLEVIGNIHDNPELLGVTKIEQGD